MAAGDYAAVIKEANQQGLQRCLESCAREDLRSLADAARLGGNAALAERALLAQRSRFPGTSDAASAAFLLGRSAESRADSAALGWYETYLKEAPDGRFAGDALGRKMVLLERSNRANAVQIAKQYLARFSSGAYAAHARSLLEAAAKGR